MYKQSIFVTTGISELSHSDRVIENALTLCSACKLDSLYTSDFKSLNLYNYNQDLGLNTLLLNYLTNTPLPSQS